MTTDAEQQFAGLLQQLTENLSWSWDTECPDLLAGCSHNIAPAPETVRQLQLAAERQHHDLRSRTTWATRHLPGMPGPIALFSAEFGLHESLPIYSGGLGILAGDHLKSASDLGIPMVGVSLFYHEGFFHQSIDATGWQRESWTRPGLASLPLTELQSPAGRPLRVTVELPAGTVQLRILSVAAGRSRLLLLDADLPENCSDDRLLTARLYAPGQQTRFRQELLLGIGGMRALQALNIKPAVVHLNEGHCAFAPLEDLRRRMVEDGLDFSQARDAAAANVVFTTHTPVAAGHDRFTPAMTAAHLQPLASAAGINVAQLLQLGQVRPADDGEDFCMTVLAFRMSRFRNAVSALHGQVTRSMWAPLWPGRDADQIPIGHITNGVHPGTWTASAVRKLCSQVLPQDWERQPGTAAEWLAIQQLDPQQLWQTHCSLRRRLLQEVSRRTGCQTLNPDALTIGFARRFATYKRADLIFHDLDLLTQLLQDSSRPLQLLFAGKAHPADNQAKHILQRIFQLAQQSGLQHHLVILEDYSIDLARHLVQGVDLWLNTPRRPHEASGTSGQKAALNGALNCSILDGWWAEAWDGSNGFAIGDGRIHADPAIQDQRDAASLYQTLQQQVLPLFFERDAAGLPTGWVQYMKNSLSSLGWRFSSHRMVQEYAQQLWLPAAGFQTCAVVPGK